jgi:hypothetical protein
MTPRKPTLAEVLDGHTRAIAGARQAARNAELAHDAAKTDVAQLREARIQALAVGDEDLAERLAAERVDAERTVRDRADRVAAAQLAVQHAEQERQRFADEAGELLLQDHGAEAQRAVEAVNAALAQLQAAHARWMAAEGRTIELLRLIGRGGERTPPFPNDLAEAVRLIGRAGEVPLPMPGFALFRDERTVA